METTVQKISQHKDRGTWVCKELVYAYAMWISPKFHLQVIRAFDAIQNQPQDAQPFQQPVRMLVELDNGQITRARPLKENEFLTSFDKLPAVIKEHGKLTPIQMTNITDAVNLRLSKMFRLLAGKKSESLEIRHD